jgi:hypothetical protein
MRGFLVPLTNRVRSGAVCAAASRFDEGASLDQIDATPVKEPDITIHLVMDNYGTHKTPEGKHWFLRHPEYHLHFIPASSSWLD